MKADMFCFVMNSSYHGSVLIFCVSDYCSMLVACELWAMIYKYLNMC